VSIKAKSFSEATMLGRAGWLLDPPGPDFGEPGHLSYVSR